VIAVSIKREIVQSSRLLNAARNRGPVSPRMVQGFSRICLEIFICVGIRLGLLLWHSDTFGY